MHIIMNAVHHGQTNMKCLVLNVVHFSYTGDISWMQDRETKLDLQCAADKYLITHKLYGYKYHKVNLEIAFKQAY